MVIAIGYGTYGLRSPDPGAEPRVETRESRVEATYTKLGSTNSIVNNLTKRIVLDRIMETR